LGSGDLANACGLPQHRLRTLKLLAAIARLASLIGPRVLIGLRVRDASALRFLGRFRLSLCGCRHEGDQRIPDCALHRVLSGTVERDAVDHRADEDAPPHKLTYRVADVLVVPPKAIDPAHDQRVIVTEQIEQSAALGSLSELCADAGDAFVPDDLIKLEAGLLSLGALVVDGLLAGADAGVQDGCHDRSSASDRVMSLDMLSVDSCQLQRTQAPWESTETARAYPYGQFSVWTLVNPQPGLYSLVRNTLLLGWLFMGNWKPQLGRITLFPSVPTSQVTPALELYQEFWRREPESFQKGPTQNPFAPSVAQGNSEELSFTCSQNPIRIDFTISPIQNVLAISEPNFPLVENSRKLREELDRLIEVVHERPSVVPAGRVALAMQFTQVCASFPDANMAVTSALPNDLRVHLSEERDFILQVNRARKSTSVQDMTINFITKWAVEQVQLLAITPGGSTGMANPTIEYHNATILCDNNNVPANRLLSADEQTSILKEALGGVSEQLRNSSLEIEGF
jgi:hypothetical protein